MNKEVITDRQGIAIIILYMTGTSSMMAYGIEAKKDAWLSILLALFVALLIALVHSRLHYIFPGRTLFDIAEICFGKFIGKGIILLYIWYLFHSGTIVLRNIGQFINIATLIETPIIMPMIIIVMLCIWIAKEGIEVLGRISILFIFPYMSAIFFVILLLIPNMEINNILPVLYEGINPVIRGAILTFSFPFGEIVAFTMAFSSFKYKKSPYKIYIIGLLISGIMVVVISLIDMVVLGVNEASTVYYPSLTAMQRIDVGKIFQRVEVIIAIVFVLGGAIKVSIYLLAACKGISRIFRCTDYRFIVTAIGLHMINLSYFIYESIMEFLEWDSEVWVYYSFVFQVILVIIIWIIAEIKKKYLMQKHIVIKP